MRICKTNHNMSWWVFIPIVFFNNIPLKKLYGGNRQHTYQFAHSNSKISDTYNDTSEILTQQKPANRRWWLIPFWGPNFGPQNGVRLSFVLSGFPFWGPKFELQNGVSLWIILNQFFCISRFFWLRPPSTGVCNCCGPASCDSKVPLKASSTKP